MEKFHFMAHLFPCHLYFHTSVAVYGLAKLHRLCLAFISDLKQNKWNRTTESVIKSLLPRYAVICHFQVWHMSFEHSDGFFALTNPSTNFHPPASPGTFPGHCPVCSTFLERSQRDPSTFSFEGQGCRFGPTISAWVWFALGTSSPLGT